MRTTFKAAFLATLLLAGNALAITRGGSGGGSGSNVPTTASANQAYRGPCSGTAAAPTFRADCANDVPVSTEQVTNKGQPGGYAPYDGNGTLNLGDNRIINPDFSIDQRAAGGSNTPSATGVYVTDAWYQVQTQASKLSYARSTVSPPTGYSYSEAVTVAAAVATPASTDQWALEQKILGNDVMDFTAMGTANAPTIQYEFQAKASTAGTYCAFIHNQGRTRSYVMQFAATTSWQTFQFTIPGDTSGTWGSIPSSSTYGFELGFDLGAGSTFQTTAGAWQSGNYTSTASCTGLVKTAAATLNISRVRFYPSTIAVPYVPKGRAVDYLNARQFYGKTLPQDTAVATNAGLAGALCQKSTGSYVSWNIPFSPNIEGGAPTVTVYNPSAANNSARDTTASADVAVTVDAATSSISAQTGTTITTTSTVTAGDVVCLQAGWKKEL